MALKLPWTFARIGSISSKKINRKLPGLIKPFGNWTVVWGPTVWKHPKSLDIEGPDNVWYVAYDDQNNTYIVAIAGTASTSPYDMAHEDYDVNSVVDLGAWIKTGLNGPFTPLSKVNDGDAAYISVGTAEGITALLNTPSQSSSLSGSTALLGDFLEGLPASSKIIFTGHSLGGALSPAVATAWLNSMTKTNFPKTNASTYPSAGPSPGNAKFVALFEQTFAVPSNPSGYQNWNVNLVNTLDIVPLACYTNGPMEKIPASFDGDSKVQTWLGNLVNQKMIPHANTSGVVYAPLTESTFMPTDSWPIKDPRVVALWLGDALLYEHTMEYKKYVGLQSNEEIFAHAAEESIEELAAVWPVLKDVVRSAKAPKVIAAAEDEELGE